MLGVGSVKIRKSYNTFSCILVDQKNVAVNKPAFMSSTLRNNSTELTVDGDNRIHPKLCAWATNQWGPWLVVNLQAEFWISSVIITNGGLPRLQFTALIT